MHDEVPLIMDSQGYDHVGWFPNMRDQTLDTSQCGAWSTTYLMTFRHPIEKMNGVHLDRHVSPWGHIFNTGEANNPSSKHGHIRPRIMTATAIPAH